MTVPAKNYFYEDGEIGGAPRGKSAHEPFVQTTTASGTNSNDYTSFGFGVGPSSSYGLSYGGGRYPMCSEPIVHKHSGFHYWLNEYLWMY
ncbi:hypothetical protein [Microvirga sp. GCM10011540]|uniref:hypothetical protein n=1 Tax=Microvirga sp. GCM10011540 TaxID=3317338 RepID=UPI00366B2DCB